MTVFAHVAMFGWIPLVLLLFALLPPRRAVLVAYIGGFLFLPNASYAVSGLPDFTKTTASGLSVLLGIILFHPQGLRSFRLRWYDIPMVVYCASPVVTSVLNGLGIYDGLSTALTAVFRWGLPYLMGRIYCSSRQGMYELAVSLFIGGLVYVPFCLWEIRMSPNLHYNLYGFRTRGFITGVRYGGYRPTVFLWTFIPVANWLAGSTIAGFWLWKSGRLKSLYGVPTVVLVLLLLVTTLLCKTMTAVFLMLIAGAVLLSSRIIRRPTILAILVLSVPLVIGLRATRTWDGKQLLTVAAMVSEERADSLAYRFGNEDALAEKALQRPLFGWGGYGRSRVYDDFGKDVSITDGHWIIVLGKAGLVGLAGFLATFMVPLLRFGRRFPSRNWVHPAIAPGAIAAAIIVMALINNVPNATNNPMVEFAMGGIVSLSTAGSNRSGRGRRGKGQPGRAAGRSSSTEASADAPGPMTTQ